jgi:hypothetical protein
VTELEALAKIGKGKVTIYQNQTTGEVSALYIKGRQLSIGEIKNLFKSRDAGFFG